jgi:hypothetical protein
MTNTNQEEDAFYSRGGVSMERVSPELASLARKNVGAILRALSAIGQTAAADNLEVHSASITRMKEPNSDIERVGLILAAVGIELPGVDQRIYSVDVVEALRTLAKANLASLTSAQ